MGVGIPVLVNLIWAIYRVVRTMNGDTVVALLVAIALLLMFISVRTQILSVQDRLIRLEMRLRLAQVLPADMRPRINELTVPQLVALRFASDAELPALTREVLEGKLATGKAIKMRVQNWQADLLRA
jgi:hypothetical protein